MATTTVAIITMAVTTTSISAATAISWTIQVAMGETTQWAQMATTVVAITITTAITTMEATIGATITTTEATITSSTTITITRIIMAIITVLKGRVGATTTITEANLTITTMKAVEIATQIFKATTTAVWEATLTSTTMHWDKIDRANSMATMEENSMTICRVRSLRITTQGKLLCQQALADQTSRDTIIITIEAGAMAALEATMAAKVIKTTVWMVVINSSTLTSMVEAKTTIMVAKVLLMLTGSPSRKMKMRRDTEKMSQAYLENNRTRSLNQERRIKSRHLTKSLAKSLTMQHTLVQKTSARITAWVRPPP